MYNLRTRVRAVPAGSARPQAGMGAPAPPAVASQVTTSQALEILSDNMEALADTEIFRESDDERFIVDDNVVIGGNSASYSHSSNPKCISHPSHGFYMSWESYDRIQKAGFYTINTSSSIL